MSRSGVSPPHQCRHCKDFALHLYDEVGQTRSDRPRWHQPNASQDLMAERAYGRAFWKEDFESYREEFYSHAYGVSFFGPYLHKLNFMSQDGCLLARRFLDCLGPQQHKNKQQAVGAQFHNPYSIKLGTFDLRRRRWRPLPSEDDTSGLENWFTVLAEPETASEAMIEHRATNPDPGSVVVLKQAKGWMQSCLHDHDLCGKSNVNFVPRRLVHLRMNGDDLVCCLKEMQVLEYAPYAALSYCWGGDQTFKTTQIMLPYYLKSIDVLKLPKTLQDAIHATHQLGLSYLWVDALCIIQDSQVDKTREIGSMAKLYSHATVTIVASRSKAVWDGFLHERPIIGADRPHIVFSLPCYKAGRSMGRVTLVPLISEKIEPLDTRGWTFQERVLSTRILDFGTLRSHFTCASSLTNTHSDGWSDALPERTYGEGITSRTMADLIAGRYPVDETAYRWLQIVEGFTQRGLGFVEDKLPAIAGLAERFGSVLNDQYCAGIWRQNMTYSLLWYPRGVTASTRLPRVKTTAPSWSWAAVEQPIIFAPISRNESWTFHAQIMDCKINLASEHSPYGAIKVGHLTIETFSSRAKCVLEYGCNYSLRPAGTRDEMESEELDIDIPFFPDNTEKEFMGLREAEITVHVLLFGVLSPPEHSSEMPSLIGLVVRSIKDIAGSCSRIGMFHKTLLRRLDLNHYLEWFQAGGRQSFVVI